MEFLKNITCCQPLHHHVNTKRKYSDAVANNSLNQNRYFVTTIQVWAGDVMCREQDIATAVI